MQCRVLILVSSPTVQVLVVSSRPRRASLSRESTVHGHPTSPRFSEVWWTTVQGLTARALIRDHEQQHDHPWDVGSASDRFLRWDHLGRCVGWPRTWSAGAREDHVPEGGAGEHGGVSGHSCSAWCVFLAVLSDVPQEWSQSVAGELHGGSQHDEIDPECGLDLGAHCDETETDRSRDWSHADETCETGDDFWSHSEARARDCLTAVMCWAETGRQHENVESHDRPGVAQRPRDQSARRDHPGRRRPAGVTGARARCRRPGR